MTPNAISIVEGANVELETIQMSFLKSAQVSYEEIGGGKSTSFLFKDDL